MSHKIGVSTIASVASLAMLAACSAGDGQEPTTSGPSTDEAPVVQEPDAAALDPAMERRGQLLERVHQNPEDSEARDELAALQEQADHEFGLISNVSVTQGHSVKFFEPSEGALAIVEKYDVGSERRLNLRQPLQDLWREIAPEVQMPAALQRIAEEQTLALALNETDALAADDAEQPLEFVHDAEPTIATELKHQTSSAVHFEADQRGCNALHGNLKWAWCWMNRTGLYNEPPGGTRDGESMASAISVYAGAGLTWCNQMGSQNYCQDVDGGQGTTFIGVVGINWLNVHVDQAMRSKIAIIVNGTNWHWGGSISANWWGPSSFGGYDIND